MRRITTLALLFVGLFLISSPSAKADGTQDYCMSRPDLCETWHSGRVHVPGKPAKDMVCFRVVQSRPQAIVFRIATLPSGQTVPGTARERTALTKSLVEKRELLLPTPQDFDEKIVRGEDSVICFGAWRLKHADLILFCNEEVAAVLWRVDVGGRGISDIDEKLAKPVAGDTSYEPLLLKRP